MLKLMMSISSRELSELESDLSLNFVEISHECSRCLVFIVSMLSLQQPHRLHPALHLGLAKLAVFGDGFGGEGVGEGPHYSGMRDDHGLQDTAQRGTLCAFASLREG